MDKAKNRKSLYVIGAVVALPALFFGLRYWRYVMTHESTDDGFITADIVPISPKVEGQLISVSVEDNQKVRQGDPLVRIDPRDYEVKVERAKAALAQAQATLQMTSSDVERYKELTERDEASKQQFDHAKSAFEEAAAQAKLAQASLKQAQLDLSYTQITAPVSGQVSRKSAVAGMYVQVGQTLMALVPDHYWVIGNFKETQVTHMQPGDPVEISIDAYPDKVFQGHVESLQAGTGAIFSVLPPENATGNYVKVVQRIPVKIVFNEDPDPKHPFAIGMSVIPEVEVK